MALSSKRDGAFFALLERQAGKACEAARTFRDLAGSFSEIDRLADRIAEIEHEADVLTHELFDKVASTFITPLDKEDLRDLSQALDDIKDCIEGRALAAPRRALGPRALGGPARPSRWSEVAAAPPSGTVASP